MEYTHVLRRFAQMFPVLPFKSEQFDKFLNNPAWGGITRFTYRRDLIAFYHFWLESQNLPKDAVQFPKIEKPRVIRRVLSEAEIQNLWHHAETFQERVILQTLFDTKARIGEMLSITRENLQPDKCLVRGKTGERYVMITARCYDMLCKLAPSGPLFLENGRVMSPRRAYEITHGLMLKAGLTGKKLGPHIIRHTAATLHIVEGGDMQTLQQELGHTTPLMTAQYARLATGQLSRKHRQLDLLDKYMPAGAVGDSNHLHGAGQESIAATGTPAAGLRGDNLPPPPPEDPEPEGPEVISIGIKTRKL